LGIGPSCRIPGGAANQGLTAFVPQRGNALPAGLLDRAAAIVYAFDTGVVAPGG
jgi:hypothetical protein